MVACKILPVYYQWYYFGAARVLDAADMKEIIHSERDERDPDQLPGS